MSSGKGSSGANSSHDYYGTVLGVGGVGPIKGISSILEDGKQVFGESGPLMYNPGGGVGDGYSLVIPDLGKIEIYWGTETQSASSTLNTYEDHPPMRGYWYFVLKDCLFGTEKQTPPTIEVVTISEPLQSVITGASAGLNSDLQANAAAVAAEYATAWHGLQFDSSRINAASFQAVADDLRTDAHLALLSPCSPRVVDQIDASAAFGDLQSLADLWFRFDLSGRLEIGRWRREGPSASVTAITANEWTSPPVDASNDLTQIPNGFDVVFSDRTQLFAEATQPVNDIRAIRSGAISQRKQLQRHLITGQKQAQLHGQEAVRLQGNPTISGSVGVRPTQAKNPDGTPIRPGDYFELDVNQEPGATGSLQLCRCIGRSFDPDSDITLEYEYDPEATPIPFTVAYTDVPPVAEVIPPVYYARFISPQVGIGSEPVVYCLPLRHRQLWTGAQVFFDTNSGGLFTSIGSQIGFALPCSLQSAVGFADTTITLNVMPTIATGVRGDYDARYLQDVVGVNSDSASRNDELLLFLVKKNPSTGVQLNNGSAPWMEVCSIVDTVIVSTNRFTATVLRGRMGTDEQDFDTAGGTISFPDSFLNYEAWVIPRSLLVSLKHREFTGLVESAGTGFFQMQPFTARDAYSPAKAYAAGLQASAAWTQYSYTFPVNESTIPANPTAASLFASGVYIGTDGTVRSYLDITVPARPKRSSHQNLLYKITGTGLTQWATAATLTNTLSTVVRIDDLTPGISYDVGTIAFSVEDRTSGTTTATSSPFLAPNHNSAPAVPTGLVAQAGTGLSVSLDWDDNTETFFSEYGVYRNTTNTPSTATKIAECRASRFVDEFVTLGQIYYYWITAYSRSEIQSAKSTSANATPTAVVTVADSTAPSNPSAPTYNTAGTYLSGDGTVSSYIVMNIPSMPSGAVEMILLYRKSGASGWQVSNQIETGGGTEQIDDLTPGISYDVAIQAFSNFSIPSAVIAATGSPFTAPNRSGAPSTPTGGGLYASAPAVIATGGLQFLFGSQARWEPCPDKDFSYFEIKAVSANSDSSASYTWYRDGASATLYQTKDAVVSLYNATLGAGFVFVRAVNASGVASAWAALGNANGAAQYGAKSMALQDAVAVTASTSFAAPSFITPSARRLKKNIRPLTGAIEKVRCIRSKVYDLKDGTRDGDIGFIAEQLAEIFPHVVHRDQKGRISGVDYGKLTPILVSAIQTQDKRLAKLEKRLLNKKCSRSSRS